MFVFIRQTETRKILERTGAAILRMSSNLNFYVHGILECQCHSQVFQIAKDVSCLFTAIVC